MGIQSDTNKIIKDVGALAQERDEEAIQLKKKNLAYKKDVLAFKKSKLKEKKAAFEKSLERKKYALERVKNGKQISDSQMKDITTEAERRRKIREEMRGKLNGQK